MWLSENLHLAMNMALLTWCLSMMEIQLSHQCLDSSVGQHQFYPDTFPQAMRSLFGSYLADSMVQGNFWWNTKQLVRIQQWYDLSLNDENNYNSSLYQIVQTNT